jgi:hypothetical protein
MWPSLSATAPAAAAVTCPRLSSVEVMLAAGAGTPPLPALASMPPRPGPCCCMLCSAVSVLLARCSACVVAAAADGGLGRKGLSAEAGMGTRDLRLAARACAVVLPAAGGKMGCPSAGLMVHLPSYTDRKPGSRSLKVT